MRSGRGRGKCSNLSRTTWVVRGRCEKFSFSCWTREHMAWISVLCCCWVRDPADSFFSCENHAGHWGHILSTGAKEDRSGFLITPCSCICFQSLSCVYSNLKMYICGLYILFSPTFIIMCCIICSEAYFCSTYYKMDLFSVSAHTASVFLIAACFPSWAIVGGVTSCS